MKLKGLLLTGMLMFVCTASAKDVEVSIDTVNSGAVTTYELKDLSVTGDGPIKVNLISKGAAPVDLTYPLVITQTVGGTIKVNSPPPYTCTGGICPSVELSYELASAVDYVFDGWSGDCAKDAKGQKCTLVMNAARAVSATFKSTATPPPLTDCKPAGTTLVEVQTTTPHPRTVYRPTPSTVHAFAFKTVQAGALATGRLNVNVLSNGAAGKLIVISECRGDVSTVVNAEKTQGCVVFGSETATLGYTVNASPKIKPLYWCNLKPNTQYYLNVIGRSEANGPDLCASSAVCGFDFESY